MISPQPLTLRLILESHYPREHIRSLRALETRMKQIEKILPGFTRRDISTISDSDVASLRDLALEKYAPSTVLSMVKHVIALYRSVSTRSPLNPRGLNLFPYEKIPYVRYPTVPNKRPRRIALEDLSKFYAYAGRATMPTSKGVPVADWWRTLIVLIYATGLRRSDALNLRWDAIDFEEKGFYLDAQKTGKSDIRYIPAWCMEHLRRLYAPGVDLVFRGFRECNQRFYTTLRETCKAAGVEPFGLHDIRRTACSEVERVRPGLGATFMQHSARSVTTASYLNQDVELREAIDAMRLPVGFNSGAKVAMKQEAKVRQEVIKIQPEDFEPIGPKLSDWQVEALQFRFRDKWYRLPSKRHIELLRILTTSVEPVSRGDIHKHLTELGYELQETQVTTEIARLRGKVRKLLGIKDGFDPIPTTTGHSDRAAAWTIYVPSWLSLEPAKKPSPRKSKRNSKRKAK